MTDLDYADDWVLLTNKPTKVESPLHDLDQAAGCIGFNVNANFKKRTSIFNKKEPFRSKQ